MVQLFGEFKSPHLNCFWRWQCTASHIFASNSSKSACSFALFVCNLILVRDIEKNFSLRNSNFHELFFSFSFSTFVLFSFACLFNIFYICTSSSFLFFFWFLLRHLDAFPPLVTASIISFLASFIFVARLPGYAGTALGHSVYFPLLRPYRNYCCRELTISHNCMNFMNDCIWVTVSTSILCARFVFHFRQLIMAQYFGIVVCFASWPAKEFYIIRSYNTMMNFVNLLVNKWVGNLFTSLIIQNKNYYLWRSNCPCSLQNAIEITGQFNTGKTVRLFKDNFRAWYIKVWY